MSILKDLVSLSLKATTTYSISVLLVDDQLIIAEAVRRMLEDQSDIIMHYCSDPSQVIQMAQDFHATVILQDLVMPDVDGLTLVKYLKVNSITRDIPLIVLSSQEEPIIKAKAFEFGANDYIVKLPDRVEFIARIRYHSAAYIRLLERNQAYKKLEESQRALNAELAEAATYVKSLLPKPLNNAIKTKWRFLPSTQLGGDAFGYQWIDPNHFIFYLLDVCGHGVGAALLSISVLNVLRSPTFLQIDFLMPDKVLQALNDHFPMEKNNDMFFTIWYGVYDKVKKELVFASGGHPPAVLISNINTTARFNELRTDGPVIGATAAALYKSKTIPILPKSRLYLFSDGIYEVAKADGSVLPLEEFIQEIQRLSQTEIGGIDHILEYSSSFMGSKPFVDDVSILEITFN